MAGRTTATGAMLIIGLLIFQETYLLTANYETGGLLMKPVRKLWILREFCITIWGFNLLISHSHQVLTLLMGDKLYLAPIPENIQVCFPKHHHDQYTDYNNSKGSCRYWNWDR